jgi:hypothetical protein
MQHRHCHEQPVAAEGSGAANGAHAGVLGSGTRGGRRRAWASQRVPACTGAGAGSRRAEGVGTAAQAAGSQLRAAAKRLLWAADGCGERRNDGAARGLGGRTAGGVRRSTGTATSSRLRRRAAGRLTARTLAWRGAARAEEDGVRGRRSGCPRLPLAPAQAWGAAGSEMSAWRRKRQGRSSERRSACFGLPAGAVRGGTAQGAARAEKDGVRGRRSGCRLEPAQARRVAGPKKSTSARQRKRQGCSRERRSACFGLPAGVASGSTAARREDSGAERLGTRGVQHRHCHEQPVVAEGSGAANGAHADVAGSGTRGGGRRAWGAQRVLALDRRGRGEPPGRGGSARRRKRQGRSCERRRSACFGLPTGAVRG